MSSGRNIYHKHCKAARSKWDQHVVYDSKKAQAVIVNAGIANACTGEEGWVTAKQLQKK